MRNLQAQTPLLLAAADASKWMSQGQTVAIEEELAIVVGWQCAVVTSARKLGAWRLNE
jgi:hypothetical protein